MKLPDIKEFINLWPKSLSTLKQRVMNYFLMNEINTDNVWFPDIDIIFPEHLLKQENIQVVLFGGFVERVFETGNWPDKNYTFWCLSTRVKIILEKLFNFPENAIRIIPRQKLFDPAKPTMIKHVDLKQDVQLVYSGRLSSQKNIEMVLAFAHSLDERIEGNLELYLMGEWDNHIPKNRGRYIIDSYQRRIEKFQKALNANHPIFFLHHLGEEEWLNEVKPNCLMINFSTFVCEDFGVSVSQGVERGLPMVLSDWGGHADIEAENTFWVDTDDIGESFSMDEKIILKGELLAEKFIQHKLLKAPKKKITSRYDDKEAYLTLKVMHDIRLEVLNRYGHELSLLGQDRMSLVTSSVAGKAFFKDYSTFFSGEL